MKNKQSGTLEIVATKFVRFLYLALVEIYTTTKEEKIDIIRYVYPGLVVAAFYVCRIDIILSWIPGFYWIRMPYVWREVVVYGGVFGGWIVWGIVRAIRREEVMSRLRAAFIYCKLEANKKFPAFIEDRPIDEHVRKLKLFGNGIPLVKFVENRENLEAHFNASIVRVFEEPGDKSRINILYAMKELKSPIQLENIEAFQDGEIPIGDSYEGPIVVNMRDVAHVLVAGTTNGGKSNFLKVLATVLTLNNKDAEVYFLDFKGGMEVADLTRRLGREYTNFFPYDGPNPCAKFLAEYGKKIEGRLQGIAKTGVSNLDAYLLRKQSDKNNPEPTKAGEIEQREDSIKRTYIIVDEIAQLYAKNPTIPKEELNGARDAVNRIARQGRAAGVHLVIATQLPDSRSFDQAVKANLPAIVCFPMVSQTASVSALGTKRAYDLDPYSKGRAIWKFGPKIQEVQTYQFRNQ